ncbi:MAG TPA: adenylate/guanylate cyclase domain-containing protein [Polyangiaceae bacterium]
MRRPRGISYRVSLVVAIPVLIVLTGAIIAYNSYRATQQSIDALTAQLFDQVGAQASEQTRAHLTLAIPAVDLVSSLLADRVSEEDITKDDALVGDLASVLRANPGFAWVSYSDARGSFVGAYRKGDELRTNRSKIENGKTELWEHVIQPDGTLRLFRHEDDTHYDPRTRPFYVLAEKEKARVWAPPYVFYDQGVPGITCAEPIYGKDGALRGVVTVDFDLDVLSKFVAALHLSPHAVVFLYTGDEGDATILAHPTLHVVAQTHKGDQGELVTSKNIPDPLVRAFFEHHVSSRTKLEQGGQRYIAASQSFPIDAHLTWRVGAIAPESDFTGPLEKSLRTSLLVSIVSVIGAVAVGVWFARTMAQPLASIAHEMERVGRFEIDDAQQPPSRFTEINAMLVALGAMKGGLRSFAAYVPRDLVRAVVASGEGAVLGGKTKELTIFFSDLAGFTTLSETLAPEALVELLGGYFDEMTRIIQSHGGTVDKFIGDAIMAFWNAPGDVPNHAERACRAALACQAKLDAMRRADARLAGLNARIGLATGKVLVGNIGATDRMNYTVMGDTVNLASRLEGLNKAYGTPVMASETTFAKAGVLARAVDVVAVKGKALGVRVYEPRADGANEKKFCDACGRALDLYLARKFEDAARAWDEALAIHADDEAAKTMKARALAFAAAPPPADWNGTNVMHEK